MKKLFLTLMATLGMGTMAYAVPAMPGLHSFTQPDGSTLTVRLIGDERGHFYLSEDNYPLLEDAAGRLCYAEIGADGVIRPSQMQAANVARRAASENDLMARADASDLQQRLMAQMHRNSPMNAPQTGMGLCDTSFPSTGEIRALVILVDYSDVHFNTPNAQDYFYRQMNEEGFSDNGGTGSARDFYIDASCGKFRPTFDVVGPVELPQPRRYYGGNNAFTGSDQNPAQMVIDACKLLDDEVDFSLYDVDKDGVIDNIFLIYAGAGEASGGPAESVWPHSWDVFSGGGGSYRFDGKLLNHYACSNEWMVSYMPAGPNGIGTFCHEFGHVLGLPDLYDTRDQGSGNGPGEWATMAAGSYNNNSRTPPTFSAYERNALSWLDYQILDHATSVELEHLIDGNFAAMITVPGKDTEFFLFENRQNEGWDAYLPSHGMLIWHIDYDKRIFDSNQVNNTSTHQYVDLVESGGNNSKGNRVPFPGALAVRQYNATGWGGKEIDVPITNIKEEKGMISFDVLGGITSLPNPTAIRSIPDEATPYTLTLEWDAVADASQYLLNVWSGKSDYVKGYIDKSVRGTRHVVTGLQPETEYHFSLRAKAGSVLSEGSVEGSASTSDMTFAFMKVNTLPAANVGKQGFTARWEAIDGADDYEITVSAVASGQESKVVAENGIDLPRGWQTTSVKNYTVASYSGKAAPSLRLDTDDSYLMTELFEGDMSKIAFWYRGSSNGETSSIDVQFRATEDDEWTTVHSINPIASTGTTISVDAPAGSHQARLLYRRNGKGVLAVDDVEAYTVRTVVTPVKGCENVSTAGRTSYDFVIKPDMNVKDEFYYTVVAVNAQGHKSLASEPRYVNLLEHSGVANVTETADEAIRVSGMQITYCGRPGAVLNVYDTTGRLAGSAQADGNGTAVFTASAPGFYVAEADGVTAKALCR